MHQVLFGKLLYDNNGNYTYNGLPFVGLACDFYPNGHKQSEVEFVDGHQDGVAREWYENGQLKFEGKYLGDGLHGRSREWYPNGLIKDESVCEFGICIESKQWDETGLITKNYIMHPNDPSYKLLEMKRNLFGPAQS